MKCLCPCPDYVNVPGILGNTTYLLKGFGTVLHYKKADRNCERCGIPLCEDCVVLVGELTDFHPPAYLRGGDIKTTMRMTTVMLCPVCEEYVI